MELLSVLLAMVQETEVFDFGLSKLGAALGAGLAIVGGGFAIGRIAASAMDGIARQPDAAGDIRTGMLIAAVLIEGVTLFALVVCFLAAG